MITTSSALVSYFGPKVIKCGIIGLHFIKHHILLSLAAEIAADVTLIKVLHLDEDGLKAQLQAASGGVASARFVKFAVGRRLKGESVTITGSFRPDDDGVLVGLMDRETGNVSPKFLIDARSVSQELVQALSGGRAIFLEAS